VDRGWGVLVEGPSGTGKSYLARDALARLGGGIIATAPGDDEMGSYHEFMDDDRYAIMSFADLEFLPSMKLTKATAHTETVKWLHARLLECKAHFDEHGVPKWPIVVTDTFTGMGEHALNQQMASLGIASAPASRSPDGAAFYGGYARAMRELATVLRAFRSMGVHWMALAHVVVRDASVQTGAKSQIMQAFVGQFREQVPGIFDLVLHSGVTGQGAHYLLSKAEPKRVTKSRFGALNSNKQFENKWDVLEKHARTALQERISNTKSLMEKN